MVKKLTAALGLIGLAALGTPAVAQAAPAPAQTASSVAVPMVGLGGCPDNYLCLYAGTNFTQRKFSSKGGVYSLSRYGLNEQPRSWGVMSYVNNTPYTARFYDTTGVQVWSIRPGGSSTDSSAWYGESQLRL
ncbi:peptidase inhibitor family I36 protein [Kribbella sp. NPDC056345]|uniref:peptidase inhibitor family I36 protein n=1 Tax=Kribbella sp. NPDC056345 TaxID=3345789 RepID=UPI0035DC1432